ncbi:MAG: hypothetical protein LBK71_03050 [Verrucomicrobiales bacterium]|jgi:hypothetical protein|nr:hypothetical protein [Verrucomicrobiales bacterium]
MSAYYDLQGQRQRRELWFQTARDQINQMLNPDGTPVIPQFDSPHRETLWLAAALYTGGPEHVDIINRALARWHDLPPVPNDEKAPGHRETHGTEFGIFQSNTITHLYHRFADKMTPAAKAVAQVHLQNATRTFDGSGQPDTKFHGANDNMPAMATQGLIFGGECLGNADAVKQGRLYLNQIRLLLSRSAWMSEFNSSTYTAVTLSHIAQIATFARDAEIRALALDIEHRLWAEVLLHFHPPTFRQAGPHSRANAANFSGHSHCLQLVLWAALGATISGRDPIRSMYQPDGHEIIHFEGCPWQSIAEWTHFLDTDFHLPVALAELATKRAYPTHTRGRSESMGAYGLSSNVYHTETYMEEDFSLGSVNIPMGGGEQTTSLFATYKLKPLTVDFRDAATVFCKYNITGDTHGQMDRSADGQYQGERAINNKGWFFTLQKDNVGLLLVTPNLSVAPLETGALRLDVVFPAHYGNIRRTLIGSGPARDGAVGESADVVPVSIEAGEVFINIIPLIPTSLPRPAALRFESQHGRYEVLQLINYEGPRRVFSRAQLELALNGVIFTIDAKKNHASLEEFHRAKSKALITDYYFQNNRFFEFQRDHVWFQATYAPDCGGVQTEAVGGRTVARPVFETSELDATKLPFVSGPVAPNFPFFPWKDNMEVKWYPENSWIIGSRGLPAETPYTRLVERIKVK